jgi:hypothetical protein
MTYASNAKQLHIVKKVYTFKVLHKCNIAHKNYEFCTKIMKSAQKFNFERLMQENEKPESKLTPAFLE